MKVSYPKHPRNIKVRITHRGVHDGILSDIQTSAEVPLNVKLRDYTVRLGYSSAYLAGFIVQLFVHGKVRIDFQSYIERLELVDHTDSLNGVQAMSLLEDFLKELELSGDMGKTDDQTQRILVHASKKHKTSNH